MGCEVWRSLDWMVDSDKCLMDVSRHESLQAALLGVFDLQIVGASVTILPPWDGAAPMPPYFESHGVDETTGMCYAMDITPLINDASMNPADFVQDIYSAFCERMLKSGLTGSVNGS